MHDPDGEPETVVKETSSEVWFGKKDFRGNVRVSIEGSKA